jgi:hypothetical protein
MTGALSWRRLPEHAAGKTPPNRRIGDLLTRDGQQFRVNADLEGDGTKPYRVTLHIDFDKGTLPCASTDGTAFTGTLTLPDKGGGTLQLKGNAGSTQEVWGSPAGQLHLDARLVEDRNLLKDLTPPK